MAEREELWLLVDRRSVVDIGTTEEMAEAFGADKMRGRDLMVAAMRDGGTSTWRIASVTGLGVKRVETALARVDAGRWDE